MLLILINLMLWIPAIAGWGGTLFFLHRKFFPGDPYLYRTVEPVWGMAALASIANWVNFVAPVSGSVATLTLLAGWALCYLRCRSGSAPKISRVGVCGAAVWLMLVAWWATQPLDRYTPGMYDAGLYYLQAIKWLNEQAVPYGLVNLHGRLAFNQSWFSLAAILELPFLKEHHLISHFLLPALLFWFYGTALGRRALALRTTDGRTLSNYFFVLSGLMILSETIQLHLSSVSPDLPVFVFTLWSLSIAIRALEEEGANPTFAIFALLFFSTFATTIKLSAAPLFLLPCSVMLWALAKRRRIAWRRLWLLMAVVLLFLLLPWLIRGVILSGCLAYPVASTCAPALPWAVSAAEAREMTVVIMAWARQPWVEPSLVLSSNAWLGPWLARTLRSSDMTIIGSLLIAGLVSWALTARARPQSLSSDSSILWFVVPLLLGIAFWFFTAPDLRFGVGYLWALALCVFGSGVRRLFEAARSATVPRFVSILFISVGLMSVHYGLLKATAHPLVVRKMDRFKFATYRRLLLTWPGMSRGQVESRATVSGETLHIPAAGNQCWLAPLPCATPPFNQELKIVRASDGKYVGFYQR